MTINAPKEPPLYRINSFKGINVSVTPTQIDETQSPDMLNMALDEKGALNKRTGYKRVFPASLGSGPINGMFLYRKADGNSVFLFAHGTKLYSGSNPPVSIYNGMANSKVSFFSMNGKCYIQDGTNFLVYDGSTVKSVEENPYIPTITISRPPAGGGEPFEDFNLLGKGFKDSFSADGTAKDYTLSLKGLDATSVKAEVNGTTMNEGSGFTVDRANGKVTFTTAPSKGTNNVIITAYKTQSTFPNRIKRCQFNVIFGGSNDTYVFVSGNPDEKNMIWKSGLDDKGLPDPSYWPENGFYRVGNDNEAVQGFSRQYDYLVIEKEFSKWNIGISIEGGKVTYPIKPINDQVGTIARDSIQVTENNPVTLSRDGMYVLKASNLRDERNVEHISEDIDRYLLNESNLEKAVSVDYDKKYWLAINEKIYILDYTQSSKGKFGEWYIFDNIPASCFLEIDGFLYFGSSKEGLVYRFKKVLSDPDPYNDDGAPIDAYWKSKPITFGADEYFKVIDTLYVGIKPSGKTSVDISYETDKKKSVLNNNEPIRFNLFDFNNIDFANFTFQFSSFPRSIKRKVKAKKITHFQLILENNKLDEGLTVLSLVIKYRYQGTVR